MDPIDILSSIIQIALVIRTQINKAKVNQMQFKRLSERIDMIIGNIQALEKMENSEQFKSGLLLLKQVVTETAEFLSQFLATKKWYKKVLHAGSHEEEFARLNQLLERAIIDLNLGINVQQIKNQEQDRFDQEEDRRTIAEKQEEIILLNEAELESIQRLAAASEHHAEIMEQQMSSMKFQLQLLMGQQGISASPIDRHLIVAFHELLFDKSIGEGAFGTVYEGRWAHQPVAIKTIKGIMSDEEQDIFVREVQIMSRLQSPWITQFYRVCLEPMRQSLVMEYMSKGSLHDVISTTVLTAEHQNDIALAIAQGLRYLHSQGVVHGDLKSENILLNNHFQAKIADFGLSKTRASSIINIKKMSESVQWMAPELFDRGATISEAADRFSYGVILWEILTGQHPFKNFTGNLVQYLKDGGRETLPATIPAIYQEIIQSCWQTDPEARMNLDEIIQKLESADLRPTSPSAEELHAMASQFEDESRTEEAREYFQKAAEKGHSHAKTSYGYFLVRGIGGAVNKREAAQWFEQAAQEGHDRAQYNLGQMFEYGDGIPKDLSKALFWYTEALKQGHPSAQKRITRIEEKQRATAELLLKR